ncbi:MAG: hypothetical protein WDN66_05080 [Candidatus Saccharibacteria bacterium]
MALTETYKSTSFGEMQERVRAARESEDRAWDRAINTDTRIPHRLGRRVLSHVTRVEDIDSIDVTPPLQEMAPVQESQPDAEFRYLRGHVVAQIEGDGPIPETPPNLHVILL